MLNLIINNYKLNNYVILLICLSSIFFTSILLNYIISRSHAKNTYQPISKYIKHHAENKKTTPTLGGIAIIASAIFNIIFFTNINSHSTQICVLTLILFFCIGLLDDLKKVNKKMNIGQLAKTKFILLTSAATLVCLLHYFKLSQLGLFEHYNTIWIPFVNYNFTIHPLLYYAFCIFIICGSSNAVNLTDGLDGLASAVTTVIMISLLILCIVSINVSGVCSKIKYISFSEDLIPICTILLCSNLTFFWYNTHRAKIFMGDCGSLPIGAFLSIIAILIKQELFFGIISLFLIIEVLSVIIQVTYFKISKGKRIFKMAPIHHHFEKSGIDETKITNRSMIFCIIIALMSLMCLLF